MATGLHEKARGELPEKMIQLREQKQSTEAKSCKVIQKKRHKMRKLGLKLMIRVKLIL